VAHRGRDRRGGVPVIVEQPIELPTRADEPYDANFANAGALAKAGVRVAFTDGSNASNARNLLTSALGRRLRLPRERPSPR
jgi:hypothetical protein